MGIVIYSKLEFNGLVFEDKFTALRRSTMRKIGIVLLAIFSFFGAASARDWDVVAACQNNAGCASCLVSGTKITMSDRKVVAVEKVALNSSVLSPQKSLLQLVSLKPNVSFTKNQVSTVAKSKNTRSLYVLIDSKGNSLTATDHHPIATLNRGFVQLSNLKVSDVLITLNGNSKVSSVKLSPRKDTHVYNLVVGSTDVSDASNHSYFANGILTGDLYVQAALFFGYKISF